MITRKDISDFIDLEAEATKKSWEALMKLPIEKRIRKRRAIQNVYLDKYYWTETKDNYILLKVNVGVNLSDFKEGEYLFLHKKNDTDGIECAINTFEGDNTIIIEVYSQKMPPNLNQYYNVPLILDKACVDLRNFVYYPFLYSLPEPPDAFWSTLIINSKSLPTFENREKCEMELEDTIKNFNLKLLPKQREAIVNSLSAKDYYLIQGPPGTGKSFVLAWIILEEICFLEHKVIVIGPNHMAINNTLGQVLKAFPEYPNNIKVGQTYHAPLIKIEKDGKEITIDNINRINPFHFNDFDGQWVIGLTPHSLYSSRARGLKCDTLIIDEAGQMTIPLALMGMIKAKKVILAGDHKQLPPIISSEKIKPEMKQSVFQSLIQKGNFTMLDVSFRMCEPICNYVSELFYDGKVKAKKRGCGDLILCNDPLYDFRSPIILHQVDDFGEQVSDEEASFIADTIAEYLELGLPADEVAVLSPFRAQAANIRRHIRNHPLISVEQHEQITSDTIDKMQGQEREVIIYSLVAGDMEYMTEMAEFLYNPNKMNVAFSRAKSKLIIVGNIEQIKEISSAEYPHIMKMIKSKFVKRI